MFTASIGLATHLFIFLAFEGLTRVLATVLSKHLGLDFHTVFGSGSEFKIRKACVQSANGFFEPLVKRERKGAVVGAICIVWSAQASSTVE